MPGPATILRGAGFNSLISASGESFSIGGRTILGIRSVIPLQKHLQPIGLGRVNFSELGETEIEIREADMDNTIVVGAFLTATNGRRYRIQKLIFNDATISLRCEQTK